jgi:hypothetical protein
MRHFRLALLVLALPGFLAGTCPLRADGGASAVPAVDAVLGVSVEDFSYLDTSGEVIDQTAAHQRRLAAFTRALREDVAADSHYHLVPPADRAQATAPRDARIKIVGGVQKTSTLVQWAKVAVIDERASQVLFEKLYTFRGDNDEAWDRARMFVSRDVLGALAAALPAAQTTAAAPISLAVFGFELEDTSAAASPSGPAPSDVAHLAEVTDGVRKLLAQSGRYRLVDISGTNAQPVRAHALRDCNGCDAAIALQLGADQSMIGVVRRVSRTEYTVGFQVRDSHTGALVSTGDSGLRMGADYSWTRGAVRLVGDRLLASGAQQ